MNLKSVKSSKDMKLDGITIDCEMRDGSLAVCTLTDVSGHMLRFALDNYSVKAYVLAPAPKKTVHVVSGKVRVVGTEIREEFDELHEANSRRSELEQSDVCEGVKVEPAEIEIPF